MIIVWAYAWTNGLLLTAMGVQYVWQYFSPVRLGRKQAEVVWLNDYKQRKERQ